ncbi:hypothetical protein LEP1GSC188_0352 [Leptospira weilii serovar Topaz str. LT2116]|uniref:Uncharacterized protein n=1 Tax=Leptospira weilii serovar Topaz str. LT2116 TaxID=1088540 RepID=M3H1M6_9LEPT|nr:hypothetical protein LEP1GSC188_0352 [Leptospira weilii serovar Topaz str. LT2116]
MRELTHQRVPIGRTYKSLFSKNSLFTKEIEISEMTVPNLKNLDL